MEKRNVIKIVDEITGLSISYVAAQENLEKFNKTRLRDNYPDIYDEKIVEKVSAADIVAAFDEAYDEVKRMQPMLDDLQNMLHKLEVDPVVKEFKSKEKSILKPAIAGGPADPIAAFLKMNNL